MKEYIHNYKKGGPFKEFDYVYSDEFGFGTVSKVYNEGADVLLDIKLERPCEYTESFKSKPEIKTVRAEDTDLVTVETVEVEYHKDDKIDYTKYIGKWGKFEIDEDSMLVAKLNYFRKDDQHRFSNDGYDFHYSFEPLTEEELKVLKLEND